jgi:argonaute-like protein implicated in RNA metabolism and viral defense
MPHPTLANLLEIQKYANELNLSNNVYEIPAEIDCQIFEIEKDVFIEFVDHDISNDHFLQVSVDGAKRANPTRLIIICLNIDDVSTIEYTAERFSELLEGVSVSVECLELIGPQIKRI